MNAPKLPFKSFAEIVLAFEAGVKFQVRRPRGTVEVVTSLKSKASTRGGLGIEVHSGTMRLDWSGWGYFTEGGSNTSEPAARLELVEGTLPYKTADELVAAFKAGVKFELRNAGKRYDGPVRLIDRQNQRLFVYDMSSDTLPWGGFRPDGRGIGDVRLVLVKAASPIVQTASAQVTEPTATYTAPAAAPEQETFNLKDLILGKKAVCPKTAEEVLAMDFRADGIFVRLRNPATGVVRESTSYRHDGTHKYDQARTLVFREVERKKVMKRIEVFADDKGDGGMHIYTVGALTSPIRKLHIGDVVGPATHGLGHYVKPGRDSRVVHVAEFETYAP